MSDYDDLRAKALAATPGPWSGANEHGNFPGAHPAWCVSRMRPGYQLMSETEGYMYDVAEIVHEDERSEADCHYIAAASPDVVLGLLDRYEALVGMMNLLNENVAFALGQVRAESLRAEAAEAAVERVRVVADAMDRAHPEEFSHYQVALSEALGGPGESATEQVDSESTSCVNGRQIGSACRHEWIVRGESRTKQEFWCGQCGTTREIA